MNQPTSPYIWNMRNGGCEVDVHNYRWADCGLIVNQVWGFPNGNL